ncbi:MAG: single-stranded-DNA-specific exonuclease RecJ [Proteobacteria bacterium]|nr:single-stranded-DNA-specific exonuclease RecJ [Pseudomonadota bacterium]
MPHHPVPKKIIRRPVPQQNGHFPNLSPLLQRIYLSRNLTEPEELDRSLAKLPSPWLLSGMENLVHYLIEAIKDKKHLLIVADFDADGATSCAVGMLGLKAMGAAKVSYIVPNRFEFGYGLTPEIVAVAAKHQPDLLITVDNGISSIEGVKAAKALGMTVLVTDHHLPGAELPEADAIVNPNLPGDEFPSKALAGVGVMFYVLMALRIRLRESGWFAQKGIPEPNLAQWLDLVALGTVADVVALDRVNRILVHQGLQRIRLGQSRPGIVALLEVAGRKPAAVQAADLGFFAGPRLNAAGRLEDMAQGIECLLCEDVPTARGMAAQLDQLNRDRREIEEQMKLDAFLILDKLDTDRRAKGLAGVCLFDSSWHQGVIGILASRVKDRLHRPVIAFAPAGNGEIKGSARSIPGVHIRDVLSNIAAAHPGLLARFGGHAMAAGLSLDEGRYPEFVKLFDAEVRKHLEGMDLDHAVLSDGELSPDELRLECAEILQQAGPWGQGFPEPVFHGEFDVIQARIVGEKHLKLVLKTPDQKRMIDGIAFFIDDPESWLGCRRLKLAYKLDVNEFRDNRTVQLRIEYMES